MTASYNKHPTQEDKIQISLQTCDIQSSDCVKQTHFSSMSHCWKIAPLSSPEYLVVNMHDQIYIVNINECEGQNILAEFKNKEPLYTMVSLAEYDLILTSSLSSIDLWHVSFPPFTPTVTITKLNTENTLEVTDLINNIIVQPDYRILLGTPKKIYTLNENFIKPHAQRIYEEKQIAYQNQILPVIPDMPKTVANLAIEYLIGDHSRLFSLRKSRTNSITTLTLEDTHHTQEKRFGAA